MSPKYHHTNEFSKRATSYQKHNIIQKRVAKKLISSIKAKPKSILDLGCGSGAVYDLIDWDIEKFVGIDKASNMCKLHPKTPLVRIIEGDFEDIEIYKQLSEFELVVASSSLQWAKDLDQTLSHIKSVGKSVAFAIFCDGTFKTINKLTGRQSLVPDSELVLESIKNYFDVVSELKEYKLYFGDNLSKFRYIKASGVSGGVKQLNYKEIKHLIANYPLDYLEFEVLFVWSRKLLG